MTKPGNQWLAALLPAPARWILVLPAPARWILVLPAPARWILAVIIQV